MTHEAFLASTVPCIRHKGLKQHEVFGSYRTFDKFKWIVLESRGISPDMVPQPCPLRILLQKIETVCVAPFTLWKHHNQTWTAAQIV